MLCGKKITCICQDRLDMLQQEKKSKSWWHKTARFVSCLHCTSLVQLGLESLLRAISLSTLTLGSPAEGLAIAADAEIATAGGKRKHKAPAIRAGQKWQTRFCSRVIGQSTSHNCPGQEGRRYNTVSGRETGYSVQKYTKATEGNIEAALGTL